MSKYIYTETDVTERPNDETSLKMVFVSSDPTKIPHFPFPKDYKFKPALLPITFKEIDCRVENFNVRADDVWIASVQKAGSTWLQNIAWLLTHNLDYETDRTVSIAERSLYFELKLAQGMYIKHVHVPIFDENFDLIDKQESPRVIKTHLPANLLPNQVWTVKPKIIYIARNPKDLAISLYHYVRNIGSHSNPLDEFLEMFLNDSIRFAPFHSHVLNYWQIRHLDHVLFLHYENVLSDTFGSIKKISEFLGCDYSDAQLAELTEHVSFGKMTENAAANFEDIMKTIENFTGKSRVDKNFR